MDEASPGKIKKIVCTSSGSREKENREQAGYIFILENSGIKVPVTRKTAELSYIINMLDKADTLYSLGLFELDDLLLCIPACVSPSVDSSQAADIKDALVKGIELKKQRDLLASLASKESPGSADAVDASSSCEVGNTEEMAVRINRNKNIYHGEQKTKFTISHAPMWVRTLYCLGSPVVNGSDKLSKTFVSYQQSKENCRLAMGLRHADVRYDDEIVWSDLMKMVDKIISIYSESEDYIIKIILLSMLAGTYFYVPGFCKKLISIEILDKKIIYDLLEIDQLRKGFDGVLFPVLKFAIYENIFLSESYATRISVAAALKIILTGSGLIGNRKEILLWYVAKSVRQSPEIAELVKLSIKSDFVKKVQGKSKKFPSQLYTPLLMIYGEILSATVYSRKKEAISKVLNQGLFKSFLLLLFTPNSNIEYASGIIDHSHDLTLHYIISLSKLGSLINDDAAVFKVLSDKLIIRSLGDFIKYVSTIKPYKDNDSVVSYLAPLLKKIVPQEDESETNSRQVGAKPKEEVYAGGASIKLRSTKLEPGCLLKIKSEIREFIMIVERMHSDLIFETNRLSERDKGTSYQRGLRLNDDKFKQASVAQMAVLNQVVNSLSTTCQLKELREDAASAISKNMVTMITNNLNTFFENKGKVISSEKQKRRTQELMGCVSAVERIVSQHT